MGDIMRASGSLYSTVNDLMTFGKAHFGMLHHPLEPVLASTQRRQLTRPGEDVALGWLINYFGDDRLKIVYKQGVVSGYSSYLGLDTEAQVAVVVLYNTFCWSDQVGHNLLLRFSRGLAPRQNGWAGNSPPTTQPAASSNRAQQESIPR